MANPEVSEIGVCVSKVLLLLAYKVMEREEGVFFER
jgi:hypothetical protein